MENGKALDGMTDNQKHVALLQLAPLLLYFGFCKIMKKEATFEDFKAKMEEAKTYYSDNEWTNKVADNAIKAAENSPE